MARNVPSAGTGLSFEMPLRPEARRTGNTLPSWTIPQTGMSLIRTGSALSGLATRIVKSASLPITMLPTIFSS